MALFKWPHVYEIWKTYLTNFMKRYVRTTQLSVTLYSCHFLSQGGKKLERARDLFEQALDGSPAKCAKSESMSIIQFCG